MQLQFRIDNSNYLTYKLGLSSPSARSADDGPEITAVVLEDKQLSAIKEDQLLDVVAQVLDHLTAPDPGELTHKDDWREQFRNDEL